MKRILPMFGAVVVAAGMGAACHHDGDNTATPSQPQQTMTQSLDTAQVLAMAKETSETDSPITIDNNAVAIAGTSESSAPIAVNTK